MKKFKGMYNKILANDEIIKNTLSDDKHYFLYTYGDQI